MTRFRNHVCQKFAIIDLINIHNYHDLKLTIMVDNCVMVFLSLLVDSETSA